MMKRVLTAIALVGFMGFAVPPRGAAQEGKPPEEKRQEEKRLEEKRLEEARQEAKREESRKREKQRKKGKECTKEQESRNEGKETWHRCVKGAKDTCAKSCELWSQDKAGQNDPVKEADQDKFVKGVKGQKYYCLCK